MLRFSITELDEADAAAAWPLVRMAAPDLDLEQWQATAQDIRDRGGGIIGVEVADGGILGIATYEAVQNPHAGTILQVHTLVSLELSRRGPVRRALRGELEERASSLGCSAIALGAAAKAFHRSRPLRVH
jgi:GNAT superfamily N-acetyltransferase